ncbi:MAG: uncharacterized protein JWO51_1903 [Rhodospirillales bacterium]|nr:uncharacterized protein [Rhodospirillales bacterium]
MIRRAIATLLLLSSFAGGADAGALKSGTWAPTGCGTEPTPPAINGSSRPAYEASIKQAQSFQTVAKQYEDCYFKEAQADSTIINAATQDQQHQLQAAFDKLSVDAKAAAERLNKKQ